MKYEIITLFAIIALFAGVNNQYLAVSRNFDDVKIYRLEDIQSGLADELLKILKEKTFEDMIKDTITISNIKAASTNPYVDDTYCDMKSHFFIVSPEKLSISFEFDYKVGETSKKGELELSIFDLLIELKTKENETKPDSIVAIRLKEKDFYVYAEDQNELKVIFIENKDTFVKIVTESIQKSVPDSVLERLSKKSSFKFTMNPLFGNQEVEIKLNEFVGYCEDKQGTFEAVVCYYSGNASNQVDRTLRNDGITDEFITNKGEMKLFINYKIFPDILRKLNEDRRINVILDKNTQIAPKLPYDFTVTSLKKILTDKIIQPFAETDEFTVDTFIDEISIGFGLASLVKLWSHINIKDQKDNVMIEITGNLELSPHVIIGKPIFDVCFTRGISLKSFRAKEDNVIKDLNLAKEWISYTLSKIEHFCLSKDLINLRDYFAGGFKTTMVNEAGIYFVGKSLL